MQPESDIAEASPDTEAGSDITIESDTDTDTSETIEIIEDSIEVVTNDVEADSFPQAAIELTDDAPIAEDKLTTVEGWSVDELESRLNDLQGAMDQLQSGDLDAAERAIESLEQRIGVRDTDV